MYSAKHWNIATRQSCPITDDSQVRPGHKIHCVPCQTLEYCHQTELTNHRRQPGETRSQYTLCTVLNIGILPQGRADQLQTTARHVTDKLSITQRSVSGTDWPLRYLQYHGLKVILNSLEDKMEFPPPHIPPVKPTPIDRAPST